MPWSVRRESILFPFPCCDPGQAIKTSLWLSFFTWKMGRCWYVALRSVLQIDCSWMFPKWIKLVRHQVHDGKSSLFVPQAPRSHTLGTSRCGTAESGLCGASLSFGISAPWLPSPASFRKLLKFCTPSLFIVCKIGKIIKCCKWNDMCRAVNLAFGSIISPTHLLFCHSGFSS